MRSNWALRPLVDSSPAQNSASHTFFTTDQFHPQLVRSRGKSVSSRASISRAVPGTSALTISSRPGYSSAPRKALPHACSRQPRMRHANRSRSAVVSRLASWAQYSVVDRPWNKRSTSVFVQARRLKKGR